MTRDLSHIAGLVEAAVFDPETLPFALERAARALGGYELYMLDMTGTPPRFVGAPEVMETSALYAKEGWHVVDERTRNTAIALPRGVFTDDDVVDAETQERSPFFQEFSRRYDIPYCAAWLARFDDGRGDNLWAFPLLRTGAQGKLTPDEKADLGRLAPVITRAAALAIGMLDYGARRMAEGLAAGGRPVVALDHDGRVALVTPGTEALFGGGFGVRKRRLWAADLESAKALRRLEAAARAGREGGGLAQAAVVRRVDGRRPILAEPVRTRGRGLDALPGVRLLVTLTDLERRTSPPTERLRALFRLAPREAQIAARLAEGVAPDAIAEELGLAPATVRQHVKALLAKTDTRRQGELVALLASLTGAPGGE